jgi:hypothetical protein
VALALRGGLGCLSFVDAAGRQFPQPAVHRIPILFDEDDVSGFGHGQQDDRTRVADDVHGHLASVRHAHAIAVNIEDSAVVHAFMR